MTRPKIKIRNDYRKNHGVPGVVYILDNPGLREGIFKIGCTRRSGDVRSRQLNIDANTGTPGIFRCIFEYRTDDCGKAEERVFEKIAEHRRGKWGQEYFEVDLDHAKEVIVQICAEVDRETEKLIQTQSACINNFVNSGLDSPKIPISNGSSTLVLPSVVATTRATVPFDPAKQIQPLPRFVMGWSALVGLWSEIVSIIMPVIQLGIIVIPVVLLVKCLSP